MNKERILISKKSTISLIVATCLVLLLPLIGMIFTTEVNWQPGDFIVAAALLLFFGYGYKVLTKSSNNKMKNVFIGCVLTVLLLSLWASLI